MNLIQKKIPNARWLRIIPIVIVANLIQWIDKSVISFALPGGMMKDLGMSSATAGLLGTAFSIGYLFLQVPGGNLAAKGKSKKLLGSTMLGWTIILFLLGTATTSTQALTYRFLLGFCEGAIMPALVTIIANWFPNEERGRANAALLASASISQIVAGPMSSIILASHNWRFLFTFSAMLSVILLVIWMIFLVERPVDAKWLSEEERNYILTSLDEGKINKKTNEKAPLLEVLKDKNIWKICCIYLFSSLGTLGLSFWLPTIIKTITKTGMTQTGFLSVIPNLAIFIGVLSIGVISDKTQKRRLLAGMCPLMFSGLLLVAMLLQNNPWLSMGVLCIACLFLQGTGANIWAMLPRLLSPEKAGSARGIINMSSNIGGLIAPLGIGYIKDVTGSMQLSWYIIFGLCIVGFLISLTLPSYLNEPVKKAEKTVVNA
ncbi:MFS transporter [Clostridium estertheticum]|uniref:MFS transporter n=1 Tax=Clostridium estertheticum TaxID=238834 RepID=UPI001C6E4E2D|nr:MFS transporter [Clostridium estertheticum]MBW9171561.1 MFS transporter [Clostridium estertheticum]WLC77058.1 MFS transporter [Clostridium estertheticum]